MKDLKFKPAKSKEDFRNNYKLHDLAEYHGKNLLTQWGIDFDDFGKDKRYEKVWEKGEDKPDIIAKFDDKKFLIDWKGKSKEAFWVNKRAIDSYINWSEKLNMPIVICFFLFENNQLKDRRFALVTMHKYEEIFSKAWDKNEVVKFNEELPILTKSNLIKILNNNIQL
jgi:Holliday junction resolvase